MGYDKDYRAKAWRSHSVSQLNRLYHNHLDDENFEMLSARFERCLEHLEKHDPVEAAHLSRSYGALKRTRLTKIAHGIREEKYKRMGASSSAMEKTGFAAYVAYLAQILI